MCNVFWVLLGLLFDFVGIGAPDAGDDSDGLTAEPAGAVLAGWLATGADGWKVGVPGFMMFVCWF